MLALIGAIQHQSSRIVAAFGFLFFVLLLLAANNTLEAIASRINAASWLASRHSLRPPTYSRARRHKAKGKPSLVKCAARAGRSQADARARKHTEAPPPPTRAHGGGSNLAPALSVSPHFTTVEPDDAIERRAKKASAKTARSARMRTRARCAC